MRTIYLDNSSTTRVCEESARRVMELMTETYGNPSSLHTMGFEAEQAVTAARKAVAARLGAVPEEITFTSGGTEANNLAILGAVEAKKRDGNRIVTTLIEHPSVLNTAKRLEKLGYEVVYLKPDGQGRILPEQLEQAITKETILVSMMLVNNEVGTVLPVECVSRFLARAKSPALFHVDAVQGFGKLILRPAKYKIDLMTVSAHKIHGPKGVGALYIAKGKRIAPQVFGGGQEKNLRPGTEAVPLIGGFGAAVEALPDTEAELARITELNRDCRERLKSLPELTVNSPEDGLPYILNVSTNTVRSETMLHFLASKGIYASSGSACSKAKPSHVLEAMGLSRERIQSSLRLSFSRYTTTEDIDALADALAEGRKEIIHL